MNPYIPRDHRERLQTMNSKRYGPLTAIVLSCSALLYGQEQPHQQTKTFIVDPRITSLIAATPAIDNHAHPMLSPPDYATDRNFDALPVDSMEPETDPAGMRPDSPALHDAWKALFKFDGRPPLDAAGLAKLDVAREPFGAGRGPTTPPISWTSPALARCSQTGLHWARE